MILVSPESRTCVFNNLRAADYKNIYCFRVFIVPNCGYIPFIINCVRKNTLGATKYHRISEYRDFRFVRLRLSVVSVLQCRSVSLIIETNSEIETVFFFFFFFVKLSRSVENSFTLPPGLPASLRNRWT